MSLIPAIPFSSHFQKTHQPHTYTLTAFTLLARSYITSLLSAQLKLLLVFDGAFEECKNATRLQRRKQRDQEQRFHLLNKEVPSSLIHHSFITHSSHFFFLDSFLFIILIFKLFYTPTPSFPTLPLSIFITPCLCSLIVVFSGCALGTNPYCHSSSRIPFGAERISCWFCGNLHCHWRGGSGANSTFHLK